MLKKNKSSCKNNRIFMNHHLIIQYNQAMLRKAICLFDVDGTLTKARNKIDHSMVECLDKLSKVIDIGYVGGSDLNKIKSQLDPESLQKCSYLFSENGLIAFKGEEKIGEQQIKDFLGEQNLQKFINYCLKYLSQLQIPCKRGTFIEYRTGMINVSPIGRNCSQKERDEFQIYDKEHNIRSNFIKALKEEFPQNGLVYSIGGQISFDVFPKGWDKTYCLRYLEDYEDKYFFGDKTFPGGNDHQIYEFLKPNSFSVKNPEETIKILTQKFLT